MRHLVAALLVVLLAACSDYVRRDEFNSAVTELRAADRELAQRVDLLGGHLSELGMNIRRMSTDYDAKLERLEARLEVEAPVRFGVDQTTISDSDKASLRRFGQKIRQYHPDARITVEGFADPSGDADYNMWLGQQRARAVRNYLVESGLPPEQIRAVSYGESEERQVVPGATGRSGAPNRRVSLVIDYVAQRTEDETNPAAN